MTRDGQKTDLWVGRGIDGAEHGGQRIRKSYKRQASRLLSSSARMSGIVPIDRVMIAIGRPQSSLLVSAFGFVFLPPGRVCWSSCYFVLLPGALRRENEEMAPFAIVGGWTRCHKPLDTKRGTLFTRMPQDVPHSFSRFFLFGWKQGLALVLISLAPSYRRKRFSWFFLSIWCWSIIPPCILIW